MIQKPFRGMQLNKCHPLSKGLVACYLFNEMTGETVFDLSGNNNNGTLENGVAWGSGGLDFDGVDDYVDTTSLNIAVGETITLEFWGKPHHLRTGGDIGLMVGSAYGFGVDATFDSTFIMKAGVGNYYGTTDAVLDDIRYHFIAVVSSTSTTVYLNGRNHITHAVGHSGGTVLIGKRDTNVQYFNGSIDSVRIYNRALSAEEIAWLYREPYAMFEPAFNPALLYSAAPPVGAIMNQFQRANLGADLYNGAIIA